MRERTTERELIPKDRRAQGDSGDAREQVRAKRVADGFCGFFPTSIRRCLEGTS